MRYDRNRHELTIKDIKNAHKKRIEKDSHKFTTKIPLERQWKNLTKNYHRDFTECHSQSILTVTHAQKFSPDAQNVCTFRYLCELKKKKHSDPYRESLT